jgi:hypothetical protein
MTRNQFLAMWNLRILNEQAFQKYKDLDYSKRERILPTRNTDNNSLIDDEVTWQNLLDKDEWYDQWQMKVEQRLASFREDSVSRLLLFQNVDLGNWSNTTANRLEKQMLIIEKLLKSLRKQYNVYVLHRTYFDSSSRCLYILQIRDRKSWTARTVDFSKTGKPAQILEHIYTAPLEHHDFTDLEFIVDRAGSDIEHNDRLLYFAIRNINKKIDKDIGHHVGLLNVENRQVWVDSLHI